MKKLIFTILIVSFVLFPLNIRTQATTFNIEVYIGKTFANINGKVIQFSNPTAIVDNRTFIEGKPFVEALNGSIDYNPNPKELTLVFNLKVICFKIGSKVASVNGIETKIDVPPFIQNGKSMIPLRFVLENLGGTVSWDGTLKLAKAIYEEKPLPKVRKITLKVIHAGSLTQPIRDVETSFKNYYAKLGVDLTFEDQSAGSVDVIKQITELNRDFDVVLLADSFLIPQYLISKYTDWYVEFATNKLVLAFTDKSKYSSIINSKNWYEILLRKDVEFGYAEPNSDPAGYRTLLMFKLAELYYKKPGLYEGLINHTSPNNIRPKSVELISLLQANEIDYAFEYESVAVQNNLKYISLPDELNLGNPNLQDWYGKVSMTLKDGTIVKGAPIVYGLTIPKNAPQKEFAERFVMYLLRNGGETFKKAGQPFIPFKAYPDIYKLPPIVRIGMRY